MAADRTEVAASAVGGLASEAVVPLSREKPATFGAPVESNSLPVNITIAVTSISSDSFACAQRQVGEIVRGK